MLKIRSGRASRAPLAWVALHFLCCFLTVTIAIAQVPPRTATKFYPDFSDTADALLRNAASHARDRQWAEAVDIYQRVIQQFGDKVAKLPKDDPAGDQSGESALYVDLRQFCQRRLVALPPEARAIYRGRVDAQAERWYRQGAERRDRSLLRRVVEQAFGSSWGDDALDLLGDLAFEDGRFDEALSMFRRLVPDRSRNPAGLIHPDPSVDLARVAAKKVLCRAALGEGTADRAALAAYAEAYPNAAGALAGRNGPYLNTLREALEMDRLAPPTQPDGRWPTFAGAPTRTRIAPGSIDVGSLQWRVELQAFDPNRGPHAMRGFRPGFGMTTVSIPRERLLSYHPIVLGDQVVICNENKISAYNLNDRPDVPEGQPSGKISPVWEAPPEAQDASGPTATFPNPTVPRYTLTAFGDRIYARLGPTATHMFVGMGGARGPSQSKIVAVDRTTEGKVLWTRLSTEVPLPRRPADGATRTGFEGTPVADARHVYVAMTDRREQTTTYVACLDAENGTPRWVRYLGAASTDAENMMVFGMGMAAASNDFGHRLLTLDGPTIYYQTNLGAVVALDAETGGIRWVSTYPRIDRAEGGPGHERDLNPAIVHDGLVFVAPDDSSAIFAFDADGGRLVWKSETIPAEVKLAHLLGVARGHLVATGDRVLLFDVRTGKLARSWPDSGHAYEGFGRGLLAGDRIYWPTKNEIHILDQATGLRTDPPIKLQESFNTTGGNLAVGDGYLIVAQPDALVVFCQNSRLIQRYRDEIARAPEQAANYFRLAQAAEATGRDELALESLAMTLTKVQAAETIDGLPLADAVRDHQFRLLMKLGAKERAAKAWPRAEGRYQAAATASRTDRDRLSAQLLMADVQVARGAAREAVATLQRLLGDVRLRLQNVASEDGRRTLRADLLIADRLAAILDAGGRALYADYDREARLLLERGRTDKDPRLLEEVGRIYPVAEVVPDSLLALGILSETSARPAEAAHAYKRLLAFARNDANRGRALVGLARAYEAQRLWVPARDIYLEALSRFADVHLEEFTTDVRLGGVVSERLSRPPFDRMSGDHSEPKVPVPLVRRWGRPLPSSVRPLLAHGVPPSAEASRIFLAEGAALRSLDPASGQTLWSTDLGGPPAWVGYLADKIIAATDSRIVALGLAKGSVEWLHEPEGPPLAQPGANPFAKADPQTVPFESMAGRFHGFEIVGGRIFCLRGERELLALDGDSGLVDWSYAPSLGAINPNLWIGPHRIVLQVRKPSTLLVLETANGRRKAEFPLGADDDWVRPPLPIDDDHVALVPDRRTISLFDLRHGVSSWVFRESLDLPKNGAPRLLGDAERLLVLHDGTELIRLDPATGRKRWSRPLGAENLSERPGALALDGARFYWVSYRTLSALALDDGSIAWSRHLAGPRAGWSLALTDRCVMANPSVPSAEDEPLQGLPLVFRRRDTGELVQRLLLPLAPSEVAVRLAQRGALVATQGGLWALGERRAADLSRAP